MKIKYSSIIPFKGFHAINLFGTFFIRKEYEGKPVSKKSINHESIHTEQMKEMGYIFFYIWYFIEWLIQLCLHGSNAYFWISFEREAYDNEKNYKYLNERKHYSWFKYYVK
jgi:hypothetical protein